VFQAAVPADVEHGVAAFGEDAADEQAAMAVSGVFLAAEQGYAEALHPGLKAGDCCLEAGVVAEAAVKDAAGGVVIGGISGATAQLRAEKEVANPGLFQGALDEFLVELRNVLGVGRAARIHHHLNAVLADKGKPGFDGVVGVAEGEKIAHARALGKEDSTL